VSIIPQNNLKTPLDTITIEDIENILLTQNTNQNYIRNYKIDFIKNHKDFYIKSYNYKLEYQKYVFFSSLDCVKTKCLPFFSKKKEKTTSKVLKQGYIQASKQKEENRKKFAKSRSFLNKKTGQLIKMENDSLIKLLNNQAQKTRFQIQQIQEEKKNDECLFLTLTLPPQYHSKLSINGKLVNNPLFDNELVKMGYKHLNNTLRQINKNIKKIDKDFKFIKMIEPHKDHTTHSHTQYWIKKENIKKIQKSINTTIKNKQIKEEIGKKTKLILLKKEEGKNVSSYITKYIIKLLDSVENEDKLYILDGWKRLNKIRLFSGSNPTINKSLYNDIVSIAPQNMDKKEYENIGVWSLKNITLINTIDNKTKIKNNPHNSTFIIHINKMKILKMSKDLDINDIKITYKRIFKKIYDIDGNYKLIRNSEDWKIIEIVETQIINIGYLYKIKTYKDLQIINNLTYKVNQNNKLIWKNNYSYF